MPASWPPRLQPAHVVPVLREDANRQPFLPAPQPPWRAALQRERQRSAALQRQLLLQRQQGEEHELALEARLHTLRRQLLVAHARWVLASQAGRLRGARLHTLQPQLHVFRGQVLQWARHCAHSFVCSRRHEAHRGRSCLPALAHSTWVPTARCRAWEEGSPLAQLFQRGEAELQREQARGRRLEGENRQLAALLAEADLERLTGRHCCCERVKEQPGFGTLLFLPPPLPTSDGSRCMVMSCDARLSCWLCLAAAAPAFPAGCVLQSGTPIHDCSAGAAAQLGDEAAAALCREHQRQLAQAQGQLRKVQEQRAALQKELQSAARRDRLAELCRRQVGWGGEEHRLVFLRCSVKCAWCSASQHAQQAGRLGVGETGGELLNLSIWARCACWQIASTLSLPMRGITSRILGSRCRAAWAVDLYSSLRCLCTQATG